MSKQLVNINKALTDYTIREETLKNVTHIVVPVVMMLEGVHNGSAGAVFHSAENLSHIVPSWNGIPVTIKHPTDAQGGYISANEPQVDNIVGKIFNSKWEDDKLKAEAWIEKDLLTALSPLAAAAIYSSMELQVSMGAYSDDIAEAGEWNGEAYDSIATNYRPDHLALLPGEEGACNWEDGCGIRANKENQNKTKTKEKIMAKKEAPPIVNELTVNEESIDARLQALRNLVYAKDTDSTYYYLVEAYDSYYIYEVSQKGDSGTHFKQMYQVLADGSVENVGDPIKVKRVVQYLVITNNSKTKKEKKEMPETKLKAIDALITNEASRFAETDREWLAEQSVETLGKLEPKMNRAEKPVAPKEVPATEAQISAHVKGLKQEELVKLLPEDVQTNLAAMETARVENRNKVIDNIIANSGEGTWTKEDLSVMECVTLEKLEKSVSPNDYSGMPIEKKPIVNTTEVAPMLPAGVKANEEKKD